MTRCTCPHIGWFFARQRGWLAPGPCPVCHPRVPERARQHAASPAGRVQAERLSAGSAQATYRREVSAHGWRDSAPAGRVLGVR